MPVFSRPVAPGGPDSCYDGPYWDGGEVSGSDGDVPPESEPDGDGDIPPELEADGDGDVPPEPEADGDGDIPPEPEADGDGVTVADQLTCTSWLVCGDASGSLAATGVTGFQSTTT
jgi:hypothetical protein